MSLAIIIGNALSEPQVSQLQLESLPDWQLKQFAEIGDYLHDSAAQSATLLLIEHQLLTQLTSPMLNRLLQHQSQAMRVLLVPDCQDEILLRQLEKFHNFTVLPLSGTVLQQLQQKVDSLKVLAVEPLMRQALFALTAVPMIPAIATELQLMLDNPDVSIDSLALVIEGDPVLTGRILQLANSPYMGFVAETSSVAVAISRLGLNLLYGMVIALSMPQLSAKKVSAQQQQNLLQRTLLHASLSRRLCQLAGGSVEQQETVLVCAMLNGVARLCLQNNGIHLQWPDEKHNAAALTYGPVAAFIMTLWGFGPRFVEPLLQQHQLRLLPKPQSLVSDCLLLAHYLPNMGIDIHQTELGPAMASSMFADIWQQVVDP